MQYKKINIKSKLLFDFHLDKSLKARNYFKSQLHYLQYINHSKLLYFSLNKLSPEAIIFKNISSGFSQKLENKFKLYLYSEYLIKKHNRSVRTVVYSYKKELNSLYFTFMKNRYGLTPIYAPRVSGIPRTAYDWDQYIKFCYIEFFIRDYRGKLILKKR